MPVNRLMPDMRVPPHPILADGHVHSTGIPVAAVVAEDVYAAYDALDLIQVEYEPLPALPEPEARPGPGRAGALPGRRRQSRAAPRAARGRRGRARSRPPRTW